MTKRLKIRQKTFLKTMEKQSSASLKSTKM